MSVMFSVAVPMVRGDGARNLTPIRQLAPGAKPPAGQLFGLFGKRDTSAPFHGLQAQSATAAALSTVALDQVRIDVEPGANTVAESWRAIDVGRGAAFDGHAVHDRHTVGGRAHHQNSAPVRRNRRVEALVKDDRVVRNVTVVAEAEVNHATAVTRTEVAAHPVVVEAVIVRTSAERDTTAASRGCREQLVAEGGIAGDRVVVHVRVGLKQVRQLRAIRSSPRNRKWRIVGIREVSCAGDDRFREFSQADGDAAGDSSSIREHTVVGNL